MKKELISDRQGIILVIMFLLGSSLLIGTGYSAKKDIWLSNIIAICAGFLIANVYARILSLFPGKDLSDILKILFGNIIGRIIIAAYIWFAFHIGALVLDNFGEFISAVALPNTPKVVPMLIFIVLCIWGVKEGIELLGRCSEFFIIVVIASLILITPFVQPLINLNELLPVLQNGIKPVMHGALDVFNFPFGESVIFTMVFSCFKDKSSTFKVYRYGVLSAGIIILLVSVRNILVLGIFGASKNYFASYATISRVHIGEFIQRLEEFVSVVFLLTGFIKICICLLAASRGISKLFDTRDYRFIVTPIGLLILNLAYFIYPNTMEMVNWSSKVGPYFFFPFQVILPLIIFITAEIKTRS